MQTISIDINKVQKGDETEFRLLFNLFYPRLMSVACRFVPEHIAEDIVQSVFVMYWEQKSALIPNAIHSFLYKCTQNNCLNYLKHQAVVLGHEEEVRLAEERMVFQLAGSDANELWNEVVERDIRKLLKASISKLPPKCRQAFELSYFKEMTYKEIAEAMHNFIPYGGRTCTESHKILERGFEGGIVLSVVFASLIPSCRLFLESVKNKMQKKHFFFFLTP